MVNSKLHVSELIRTKNIFDECGESLAAAGRAIGISRQAVQQRLVRYSTIFDDYIPKYTKIANYEKEADAIIERVLTKGYANLAAIKEKEKIQLSNPTIAKRLNINKEVLQESRALKSKGDIKTQYLSLVATYGKVSTTQLLGLDRNLYARIYYYWKSYKEFLNEVLE